MLFYLVLRGLDTVEDDMTIPIETKDKMLREFYTYLNIPGWNFSESE
jgi:farnesyl-diphosphate farnesyltransferase